MTTASDTKTFYEELKISYGLPSTAQLTAELNLRSTPLFQKSAHNCGSICGDSLPRLLSSPRYRTRSQIHMDHALPSRFVSLSMDPLPHVIRPTRYHWYRFPYATLQHARATRQLGSVLRTYAVCGKNRSLAALLVLLCLPVIAISTLLALRMSCTTDDVTVIYPLVYTVGGLCDAAIQSVIVLSTAWVTWSQVVLAHHAGMSRRTISHSVLRNGLVYYGCVWDVLTSSPSSQAERRPSVFVGYSLGFKFPQTNSARLSEDVERVHRPAHVPDQVGTHVPAHPQPPHTRGKAWRWGSASGMALPAISSLRIGASATGSIVQALADINEDFGEPLVHPSHSVDRRTVQREVDEGMELRERYYFVHCEAAGVETGVDHQ